VLLEDRQDDAAAGRFQRMRELRVLGRCRWRTKVDIEKDVLDAGIVLSLQYARINAARPRPRSNLIERRLVDGKVNDTAGCRARCGGKAVCYKLVIDVPDKRNAASNERNRQDCADDQDAYRAAQ
jgi:hypothetical protein